MSSFVPLSRVQTPPTTRPRQWRPGPFENMPGDLDRSQLDQAFKVIYDRSFTLEQSSVQGVASGTRVASGALSVTGSLKAVATGLSTLSNIVVSVDSGLVPSNLWVTAQPSPTVPGAFDVAVFKPTSAGSTVPTLNTTSAIVRWIAYGT